MDFSDWRDADYYDLSSQTTINSLASIKTEKNTSKFLVSCISGHFHSVEYHQTPSESGKATAPLMKTIQFSNLPAAGDAEIVGISVFERLPPSKGLVVGITYVIYDKQRSPEQQESMAVNQALNVYSLPYADEERGGEGRDKLFNLDAIAENSQTVSLPYIPYCLKNTVVEMNGVSEPVFLIGGSDYVVHAYKEDSDPQLGIVEMVSASQFPEFKDLDNIVARIEITKPDPDHRVTAMAFQNGPLEVYQVCIKTLEIISVWKAGVDGPISCLHFFTHRKKAPVPPCFQKYVDETGQGGEREEMENPDFTQLHLLMTTHLQPSVVYWNVLNSGLTEVLTLPDSNRFDVANCGLALDVDFDGENEVIVGTFGEELLVYKFFSTKEKQVPVPQSEREMSVSPPSSSRRLTVSSLSPEESSKHRHKSEEGNPGGKSQDQQRKVKSQENLMSMVTQEQGKDAGCEGGAVAEAEMKTILEPHYRLQGQKPFPCPIMALGGGDMMGDGVENLIVLTCFGIHILQPDVNKLMDLITERLKQMELYTTAEGTVSG